MRNFYYLTSSNSQRWDADCYIYLRAKIRGTSLMEIWTRERDSNSHNRICSTTHNLSVTTSIPQHATGFLYIDTPKDSWASGNADLKQNKTGDPGDRVHQQ